MNPACWWLHPLAVIGCVQIPIILLAHLFSGELYLSLWKTPKYLNSTTLGLSIGCILALCLGFALGTIRFLQGYKQKAGIVPQDKPVLQLRKLNSLCNVSVALTAIGAIIWGALALKNGFSFGDLVGLLSQETFASNRIKHDFFKTLPGITTMTQFGMAAAITSTLMYKLQKRKSAQRVMIFLLALNGIRAMLLSERLALIEVAVPMVVVFVHLGMSGKRVSTRLKVIVALTPIVGVFVVFGIFAGLEAFRSWTYYSSRSDDSLITFAAARLTGYYVTAVNNSALMLDRLPTPTIPIFTQQWLWKFPGMRNMVGGRLDDTGVDFTQILQNAGNPEFNNPGGILLPLIDFGTLGGLSYWVAFGFVVSKLYRSFINNETAGLLLYPLTYVGLLELSRVLYLSDTRSFPSIIILILGIWYLRPANRRARKIKEFRNMYTQATYANGPQAQKAHSRSKRAQRV